MNDNFGFIHEKLDIKILILYILRRLAAPVTFEQLTELTMCDDGIGYFDFADCVADLIRTEHIESKEGKYSLTAKGGRNSAITENNLPYTVRLAAERSTHALRTEMNRDSMIKTSRERKNDGGFTVRLTMSDGIGEVVSIEMLAMNENQAIGLESGFRKGAEGIYNALVEQILGGG